MGKLRDDILLRKDDILKWIDESQPKVLLELINSKKILSVFKKI
jgi:hypothetical protein